MVAQGGVERLPSLAKQARAVIENLVSWYLHAEQCWGWEGESGVRVEKKESSSCLCLLPATSAQGRVLLLPQPPLPLPLTHANQIIRYRTRALSWLPTSLWLLHKGLRATSSSRWLLHCWWGHGGHKWAVRCQGLAELRFSQQQTFQY